MSVTFLGCIGPDSERRDWDSEENSMWIIEFRSGTYFQNLQANNGGPARTAMQFTSRVEAEKFMDKHTWIYLNGGMAVKFSG